MRVDMIKSLVIKYIPIIASIIMFLCWIMTYSLLTEQFNYVKGKDEQFTVQKEKIQQLEYKIDSIVQKLENKVDSTNATLKNVNTNLHKISRWVR